MSKFSAAPSATGYLYQVSWALADLLAKAPERPDQALTIEGDDDIEWGAESGDPRELLQTKVHGPDAPASTGVTDMAVDLWKTIRVWMERPNAFDADGPDLTLVTTSVAPDGSAAWLLAPGVSGHRHVDEADDLLATAADESGNNATETVRAAYLAAPPPERRLMLSRVQVLDGAFQAADVLDLVRRRLDWALPSGGEGPEQSFLDQVWGWWYRRVVRLLAGDADRVTASEFRSFVHALRDDYTKDALPTTIQIADVKDEHIKSYEDFQFVRQLRWVNYSDSSLRLAIIDYHRAVSQETYWMDHQLLGLDELEKFEANLRFEWERLFAQMIEDLSYLPVSGEEFERAKEQRGQELARAAIASAEVVVRAQYQEGFFARGKRHVLADSPDTSTVIGWHADFQDRLAGIFTPPAGVA